MTAYRRMDDLCNYLPVHRDQFRAQRSVTSMGSLYLYCKWNLMLTLTFSQFRGCLQCFERNVNEESWQRSATINTKTRGAGSTSTYEPHRRRRRLYKNAFISVIFFVLTNKCKQKLWDIGVNMPVCFTLLFSQSLGPLSDILADILVHKLMSCFFSSFRYTLLLNFVKTTKYLCFW